MPTIFSRIIAGEIPGAFVWRDQRCVAFLSINPLNAGHTLVVPIEEIDHWIDMSPELSAHVMSVAHLIGRAQQQAFSPERVGLLIAGFEVPHAHVHVIPVNGMHQLALQNAARSVDPAELAAAADKIRVELRALGAAGVAD